MKRRAFLQSIFGAMGLGAAIKVVEQEAQATPLAQVASIPAPEPIKITVAAAEELVGSFTKQPLRGASLQGYSVEDIQVFLNSCAPQEKPRGTFPRYITALQHSRCPHTVTYPDTNDILPQVVAMVNVSGACISFCQICGHIRDYPKGLVPLLRSGKFTEETGGDAYDSALHLAFASGWIGGVQL